VDEGKNPDLYVGQLLKDCVQSNEKTKGKIETMKGLSEALRTEITTAFPDFSSI